MNLRMLIVLALCALLARPGQAITPTDFFPLEVGNKWTYKHDYFNVAANHQEPRVLFEIPGYDNLNDAPRSLRRVDREFTIEITHTEWIEGFEYFVFSRADYDWPPVPKLFWAGQKVRLSDEGVLLFRWNGEDVPLYNFNPQHPNEYSIPAYPIRENLSTKLDITRWSMGKFGFDYPEIDYPGNMYGGITFKFLVGYGGTEYDENYYLGRPRDAIWSDGFFFFHNVLYPISAIISGEAVSYQQVRFGNTHVQSNSWGQLKRSFRP